MEPTELRIGNIFDVISRNNEIHLPMGLAYMVTEILAGSVSCVRPDQIPAQGEKHTTISYADTCGLPLTEEWLRKVNYWRHEHGEGRRYSYLNGLWSHSDHEVHFSFENGMFIKTDYDTEYRYSLHEHKIEFVHQFQNFHHALAGKDFVIE